MLLLNYRLIQLIEVLKHPDRPPIGLIRAVLNYNWFVSVMIIAKSTWNGKQIEKNETNEKIIYEKNKNEIFE